MRHDNNHPAHGAPEISAQTFLQFARDCADCRTEQEFRNVIVRWVRPMLPHGLLAAVIGRVDLEHLEILRFLGVDYPDPLRQLLPTTLNLKERPVVARWLKTREPQVVRLPDDASLMSVREQSEIKTFRLGRLAIHGVVDLNARTGTYFSFGQVADDIPASVVAATLRLITPSLNQALMTVHQSSRRCPAEGFDDLSPTERDLLHWIVAGRTNLQIALLRGRSVATIRNQLHSAFAKLGVTSRVEAARLVLNEGGSRRAG